MTTIHHGDCIEVMRGMEDNSIDAIVTDPPYGLGFMGKKWDELPPGEEWARECLRVLKPGGHLLSFGGTRTWHRLAVAVEDAGFEIRDSIAWMYGSGFPKSLDVSKAIDKAAGAEREIIGTGASYGSGSLQNKSRVEMGYRPTELNPNGGVANITAPATEAAQEWKGWGTALKPAFEPVVVARKPLAGTVAQNVLQHRTGALNIDDCRIGFTSEADKNSAKPQGADTALIGALAGKVQSWESATTSATTPSTTAETTGSSATSKTEPASTATGTQRTEFTPKQNESGRWPANVALDEAMAQVLDGQSGTSKSPAPYIQKTQVNGDVYELGSLNNKAGKMSTHHGDSGGASRFFYVAKASKKERPVVEGVAHPTVKPLALMRWLVRLVTPEGGVVLDPFAGSGTTVEAAILEGFQVIGIEREAEYLPLIQARIERNAA